MIVGAFLTPFLRARREHHGLSTEEANRPYPGDEIVPAPRWGWTHAIEITAASEQVWAWVAQLGADRGGFYSYVWLENLVGCKIRNAETIHPEWEIHRGDGLSLHPKMPPLCVADVSPGRWFVASAPAVAGVQPWVAVSWLFHLQPLGPRRCRLVSRYRVATSPDWATRLAYGPLVVEPIGFAMDRRMLRGIKERAERHALRHDETPELS